MNIDSAKLVEAFRLFDAANAEDPNIIQVNGADHPKELFYAERLYDWVMRLDPEAPESLQLAARCQHICRWQVPRDTQPMTRAGYLKWREGLKDFHAKSSRKILEQVGYDEEMIERVNTLNHKRNLKSDAECQTLEDALCLVFLEYQFDDLIATTDHDKMVKIVQKTWGKMSDRGHEEAVKMSLSEAGKAIIEVALG